MSFSQRRTVLVALAAVLFVLATLAAIGGSYGRLGSNAPTRSAGWTWDALPTD